MQGMSASYHTYVKAQQKRYEYLLLYILFGLLQSYRWVRLEELANKFPQRILFESRRRKIQRLPQLTLAQIWFPLFTCWLKADEITSILGCTDGRVVESLQLFASETKKLMALSAHKQRYYQRGQRAVKLIRYTL